MLESKGHGYTELSSPLCPRICQLVMFRNTLDSSTVEYLARSYSMHRVHLKHLTLCLRKDPVRRNISLKSCESSRGKCFWTYSIKS